MGWDITYSDILAMIVLVACVLGFLALCDMIRVGARNVWRGLTQRDVHHHHYIHHDPPPNKEE